MMMRKFVPALIATLALMIFCAPDAQAQVRGKTGITKPKSNSRYTPRLPVQKVKRIRKGRAKPKYTPRSKPTFVKRMEPTRGAEEKPETKNPEKDKKKKGQSEEFALHQKRAQEGYVSSQYQTGMMFLEGNGTKADSVAARYWFTKAANNGHEDAIKKLQELAKPQVK